MGRYFAPIERQAESLLGQVGLLEAPVNVNKVAVALGLIVKTEDLKASDDKDWLSGALIMQNGRGVIVVNNRDNRKRRRFTVGHEIGHYILHNRHNEAYLDKDEPTLFYRSERTNPQEKEANVFAAGLLMPQILIDQYVGGRDPWVIEGLIPELAKVFDVSDVAMTYRLTNLGYLN